MGEMLNAYKISEDLGVDGDNIKMDLWEMRFGVWIGYVWLRVETCGWLL
jgi:hypothetical protein